ncbi:hypothetical protein C4579_01125 [Candidatus Microgenomates bacterium]|nr:MAG: hypothetical protein C4579_01125 [Candidatus Microgenomates bacterium]
MITKKRIIYLLFWLIVVGVLSLLSAKGLFYPGYFESHDGIIHAMRQAHFNYALQHGQFPVRWLSTAMAGFGSPVLLFNWSLPYYLASALYLLGLSIEASLEVVLGASLLLSGVFCFLLVRQLTSNNLAGVIAGVLYVWAPYHMTDVYIRGALGETVAFVFLPLQLWLVTLTTKNIRYTSLLIVIQSIVWLLFFLTHNLIALFAIGLYVGFTVWLGKTGKLPRSFIKIQLLSLLLGLLLSAFFWLPAIVETQYIRYQQGYGEIFKQFPSISQLLFSPWKYAYAHPDAPQVSMSFRIGIVHISLFLLSILYVLYALVRKKFQHIRLIVFFMLVVLVSFFFSSNLSKGLYALLPQARIIGFPWRFLTFTTFALSVLAGLVFAKVQKLKALLFLLIIGSIFFSYWNFAKVVSYAYSATDQEYFSTIRTNIGFMPDTEFLPPNVNFPQMIERYGLSESHQFLESEAVSLLQITQLERSAVNVQATVVAQENTTVTIQQFAFPGWQVVVDGSEVQLVDHKYGLINFSVNRGMHTINARFVNTPIRRFANAISLVTAGILGIIVVRFLLQKKRERLD